MEEECQSAKECSVSKTGNSSLQLKKCPVAAVSAVFYRKKKLLMEVSK